MLCLDPSFCSLSQHSFFTFVHFTRLVHTVLGTSQCFLPVGRTDPPPVRPGSRRWTNELREDWCLRDQVIGTDMGPLGVPSRLHRGGSHPVNKDSPTRLGKSWSHETPFPIPLTVCRVGQGAPVQISILKMSKLFVIFFWTFMNLHMSWCVLVVCITFPFIIINLIPSRILGKFQINSLIFYSVVVLHLETFRLPVYHLTTLSVSFSLRTWATPFTSREGWREGVSSLSRRVQEGLCPTSVPGLVLPTFSSIIR